MQNLVKAVCCLFILAAPSAATAQTEQQAAIETIDLPLRVEAGLKKKVSYVRDITSVQNGDAKSENGRIIAFIEILAVDEDEFTATWTTKSVERGGQMIDENSADAAAYLIGAPLEFSAALDGSPTEIKNASKIMEDVFNSTIVGDVQDKDALRAAKDMFTNMAPDTLAQVLLKVPSLLSICQGTSLRVGEMVSYETELANPLNGESLPATGSYLLSVAPREGENAVIEWRQEIDPKTGKASLISGMKSLLNKSGADKKALDEIDDLPLTIAYSADCEVDPSDGWVRKIDYRQNISMQIVDRKEEWSISVEDAR